MSRISYQSTLLYHIAGENQVSILQDVLLERRVNARDYAPFFLKQVPSGLEENR